jgi:hypothetical protein
MVAAPGAFAETIFVGPRAACTTLACGINAANDLPAGATVNIFVAPGTYPEGPVVISRPHTRVLGKGPVKPRVLAQSPVVFGAGVFEVVASDVQVCGFDISYSPENDGGGSGFGAQGSLESPVDDYVFCDNVVEPGFFGAIASVNASGTMRNNEYLGPGGIGAAILGGTREHPADVRVIGNHFANGFLAGISILGAVYDANGPLPADGYMTVTAEENTFENFPQGISTSFRAFSGDPHAYNRVSIVLHANRFSNLEYDLTTGSNQCETALFDAYFNGTNPMDCLTQAGSLIQFRLGGNHYSHPDGATAFFGFDVWAVVPPEGNTAQTLGYLSNSIVTVVDPDSEITSWDTNVSLGTNDTLTIRH